jgi:hypothetical protein
MSGSRSARGGKISGGGVQDSAIWQIYGSPALMSDVGQKQTLKHVRPMSAFPPKADMPERAWDVRFVPIADVALFIR